MKKTIATFILLFTVDAQAVEGEVLAKQWACLGCHSIQHIGISYPPALVRVAEKYRNDPEKIKYSIRYGKGKMPAHSSLTEAEISTLTEWILTLQ
jgi:cytochrome c551/c552